MSFTTWLGFTGKFEAPGPPSCQVRHKDGISLNQPLKRKDDAPPTPGKAWTTFDRSLEPHECSVGCGRIIPPGEVHARPHWPGPPHYGGRYTGPPEDIQQGERKVVAGVYWCKHCFNESCAQQKDEPYTIP